MAAECVISGYCDIPRPDAQLLNAGSGNPTERETRYSGITYCASADKEEDNGKL